MVDPERLEALLALATLASRETNPPLQLLDCSLSLSPPFLSSITMPRTCLPTGGLTTSSKAVPRFPPNDVVVVSAEAQVADARYAAGHSPS